MKPFTIYRGIVASLIAFGVNAQPTPSVAAPLTTTTYYFYSATSDKDFDGSSITWQGSAITGWTITGWNMIDTANPAISLSSAANNSTASGAHLTPDVWSFDIYPDAGTGYFTGQDSRGLVPDTSYLQFDSEVPLDPPGTWVASVPEVFGTLPLLGIGFVGLAAARKLLRCENE